MRYLKLFAVLGLTFAFSFGAVQAATTLFPGGGGTGWGFPGGIQANTFMLGNGTSPIATTSIPLSKTFGGTGTTTAPSSQLLYGGSSAYQSVATTSVTCSGSTTCTTFTAIGGSPITISSTGGSGSGLSTTTPIVGSNLLVYSSVGAGSAYGIATSTLSVSTGLTNSGTLGSLVGGSSATISFAAISANSIWANGTGVSAVPTVIATSSLGLAATILGTQGQNVYMQGTNSPVGTSTIFTTVASAVGINTLVPAAQLDVKGTTTDYTAQAFDAWDSANNTLFRVRNDGAVGVGTTSPSIRGLDIAPTSYFADAVGIGSLPATNTNPMMLRVSTSSSVANTTMISGVFSSTALTGASNAMSLTSTYTGAGDINITGLNSTVVDNRTVDCTQTSNNGGCARNRYVITIGDVGHRLASAAGVSAKIQTSAGALSSTTLAVAFNAETPGIQAGNVIDSFVGLYAQGGAPVGTLTNRYGVYVDDLLGGVNRFGIYQVGGSDKNYFNGFTGIGTSTPTSALSVSTSTQQSGLISLFTVASTTNATLFNVFGNGNVGIGSSTPGSMLSIGANGWNFYDNATSTKNGTGGVNITDGCYAKNGVCISTGGSSLTGTTGQVAYFSGTNTAVGTSTLFITPAGNVGIGTITPTDLNANARLTVSGVSSQDIVASTTDNTTLSDAIIQAYAPGSRVFLGAHGTNQVSTQYGITVGGWGEIAGINSTSGTSNGILIGTRTTATPIVFGTNSLERLRISSSGNLGIGSSTPWALLGIASTTYNTTLGTPLLNISTSSDDYGQVLYAAATNSVFSTLASAITNAITDIGVRVAVGTAKYLGGSLLDQFTVNGRVNTTGWNYLGCDAGGTPNSVTGVANGNNACGSWAYGESEPVGGISMITPTATANTGYTFQRVTGLGTLSNIGGMFAAGANGGTGWITAGTSTPVMEASVRFGNTTGSVMATTTTFVGFTSASATSPAVSAPTDGCYFTASSTQNNWRAITRAGSVETNVDTGVSSTTDTVSGIAGFRRFRVELDNAHCALYIQNTQNANLVRVANIVTNIPSNGLNAAVFSGNTGTAVANLSPVLDLMRLRLWYRDMLPVK